MARRIGATVLAVVMIAGAWFARDRIDDDSGSSTNAGVLVCASEFGDVCRTVAGGELAVVVADAGSTIDELGHAGAEPALWLTFDGFPQMLNITRERSGADSISYVAPEIASSPISVVVTAPRSDDLAATCGDPIDLGCVGSQTALRPAVSNIDSGIGLIAVTAAVASRAGDVVDFADPALLTWARSFRRGSDNWDLTAGTAIATMQTRPAMSVALGAEAELVPARRDEFSVLYADPMVRARVVLLTPNGFEVPDDLRSRLTAALVADGWEGPADPDPGSLPRPEIMIAVRAAWAELG